VARLARQAAAVWARELAVLRSLGLSDGSRLLDVGCGAGAVLAQLVAETRPLCSVGVEPALPLARHAVGATTVVRADGERLPFAASSFDTVLFRLVLRHAPRPARLLAEAVRVLVPGGLVVVADTDEEALFLDPSPPGFAALKTALLASDRRRGGDPTIGRRLRRLLLGAGLVEPRIVAVPVTTEDLAPAAFIDILLAPATRPVDADLLSRVRTAAAWKAVRRWARQPGAFGCVLGLVGGARKAAP
jgi:ubiquinone/menaquinone biosynthesis C-methylase UbiE